METGQTTFSSKCHSLLGSSLTPHADGGKMTNCLCSALESAPKSRLVHCTISFATGGSRSGWSQSTSLAATSQTPSHAECSPGKDILLHWWPNVLDPLDPHMRAWLPAGTNPELSATAIQVTISSLKGKTHKQEQKPTNKTHPPPKKKKTKNKP